MPNTPPVLVAGGTIRPCRFVKLSTTADFTGLEADANDEIIGISREGTNKFDSANAAVAGDPLPIIGDGEIGLLEVGAVAIVRGARLKSDADGKAEAIAATGTTIQQIGAVALQSGGVGEKIRVQVMALRSERPALT
jgi:hypothetical protein